MGDRHQKDRRDSKSFHGRQKCISRLVSKFCLFVGMATGTTFSQVSLFDSLPATAVPDSTISPTWLDSTRSTSDRRGSARWTIASRDGTQRQNLSSRGSWEESLSWEIQQADPGGLRRRRLAWHANSFDLALGDLGPWRDHPLLEGTSMVSGPRDTSLDRQILLGSGTHPNGADLGVEWNGFRVLARQRVERASTDAERLSSAAVVEYGFLSAGFRVADSGSGSPGSRVATLGWRGYGFQGEVAMLEPFESHSAAAIQLHGGVGSAPQRLEIELHHLEPGFRHDGLSKRWSVGTAGSVGLKRELVPDTRLSVQLDGSRDSLRKVGARTHSILRIDDPLFVLELGGSFSENMTSSPRWSVGSRWESEIGFLIPRVEFAFSDSALRPTASVRFELCARTNSQELSTSGSYSTTAGPRWTGQHKTVLDAESRRLEFLLSVASGLRPASAVTAQGSIACTW
jgi:hypothetical protein